MTAKEIAIEGMVVPIAYDEFGDPSDVAIVAPSGERYVVFSDDLGEELFGFVDDRVIVQGVLVGDSGEKTVKVRSYDWDG